MPPRILVLDDEPAIRDFLTRALEDAGYEVDTLSDASTVLEAVWDRKYDLVITNSVMSGARGAGLVARLHRLHPLLPLLHLDDQSQLEAPEFPADVPTLHKPFLDDLLISTVRRLLGR
jgi:DNA-binding NtrC family response regulator